MSVATSRNHAFGIGRLVAEHRGGDVALLDVAAQSGWTDWFVIATATSVAQLRGLARFIDEYAQEAGIQMRGGTSIPDEEEWVLLDLGDIVVHLMTERARTFYELERLWFQAEVTRLEAPKAAGEATVP
jgi:ribosome-associated protein